MSLRYIHDPSMLYIYILYIYILYIYICFKVSLVGYDIFFAMPMCKELSLKSPDGHGFETSSLPQVLGPKQ